MKAHFIRSIDGLIPVEEDAEKVLKRIGLGEVVQMDYKPARNYKFHKKFFAMIQHVFENQDKYDLLEDMLIEVKLQAGHYQEHVTTGGKITYQAKSISFDHMDELEFQEFYEKAIQGVIRAQLATPETINYISMNF